MDAARPLRLYEWTQRFPSTCTAAALTLQQPFCLAHWHLIMKYSTHALAAVSSSALCAIASADFVGWTATIRNVGTHELVDIFAAFDGPTDRLFNVFDAQVSAANCSIYQQSGMPTSRWMPATGTASWNSVDSFVTLGSYMDGGQRCAAMGTTADPNFTNYGTFNATQIPSMAGWYNNQPAGQEGMVEDMSTFTAPSFMGATASYGVWVAHMAIPSSSVTAGSVLQFNAKVTYTTMVGGGALFGNDAATFALPAPGAFAMLGLAGVATGTRRRR